MHLRVLCYDIESCESVSRMILRDPFRWNRSPTVGQSFKFRYANPRGVDTANSVPIFHVSAQLVPEQGIVVGIRVLTQSHPLAANHTTTTAKILAVKALCAKCA